MNVLAQYGSGGGGGGGVFSNPNFFRFLIYAIFGVVVLLGAVIRKINERNAKREVEVAKQRRQEQILRTGRAEDGSIARAPAAGPGAPTSVASPDDARRKLPEHAERRRRELAEMMRRAQGGAAPASAQPAPRPAPRQTFEAPPRTVPPVIVSGPIPTPARRIPGPPPRQQRAPAPTAFGPVQQPGERDIRRQREVDANKKAAKEAVVRRKAQEQRRPAPVMSAADVAYQQVISVPTQPAPVAPAPAKPATAAARVAIFGVGTGAGPKGGPAEWRRAIIISELLGAPVGMRE